MVYLAAGALSVRYSKLRDRLSHTIGITDGDTYLPLLGSIEGSEEESWPASPPMQQMVEECFTPGISPVLLGVGLSGNGHWSTAIESQNNHLLKFDIACKNSKGSTFFGSQYHVLTQVQPSLRPNCIELVLEPEKRSLNLIDLRIEFSVSIGQLEFSNVERRIWVSPNSELSSIQTHRWCYEISLFVVQ